MRTEILKDVLSSLVAAVSILELAYNERKAPNLVVPSDKMFKQMLQDYNASIIRARTMLKENSNS